MDLTRRIRERMMKERLMFVLESLQNVSRHSDPDQYANMSLVVYSKTDSDYTVTTGNVIETERINDLKSKLNELNKLESSEIRKVYRQMLSHAEFSSKGGAGLGFIEMARKSGNKLLYQFDKINEQYSYFMLTVKVEEHID